MPLSTRTGREMVSVLYCDLDGTVRKGKDELGRFVNGPKDVELFEGMANLLWGYRRRGWRIIAVSNQGGIALGHLSDEVCEKAMGETMSQAEDAFDKMTWCPHYPGEGIDPEMAVCWCRKPRPGMVISSALVLSIQTGETYPPHLGLMVGDRPEDRGCAENAGLPFLDAAKWRTGAHLLSLPPLDD
jgi:D-glycero-D-manno-heptose 1,7-bisphosphate phosphatase